MKTEILRPSELGAAELTHWRALMAGQPALKRAFFSPAFARACETAHGLARVAVLHEGGAVRGFLPFQFASPWHRRAGLAERIGGELSDNAGLIAQPGTRVDPVALLRQCRLGALYVTHLVEGQEAFGLAADSTEIGHVIDVSAGSAAYLASLRKNLVSDTGRRVRRAEREYGPLRFVFDRAPSAAAALEVIAQKRAQYRRTHVGDVFEVAHRLRLIEALCADPAEDCRPVLTSLIAGERVLAQSFSLLCGDVFSDWFPVYDPAAEDVSPGRLQWWLMLQQTEACGVALIDRGAGDSRAKQGFSTGTVQLGRANFFARTPRGTVARLFQAAEWRLAARRNARIAAPAATAAEADATAA